METRFSQVVEFVWFADSKMLVKSIDYFTNFMGYPQFNRSVFDACRLCGLHSFRITNKSHL